MTDAPTQLDHPARRPFLLSALAVFVVGLLMGAPTLRGGFLSGDDVHLVLNHVLVNHPSVAHALELITMVHRDLYQPVPMLSFSFDFVIIGLLGLTPDADGPAAGAWVFHLTNVVIHAGSGVLVFWLLTRLDGRRTVGVVAAVLFLLHPYAAEVVAWLNGRMMLLATFFSLASLIALDKYLVGRRRTAGVLAIVFTVLAMTSKIRVGLPILMLILPAIRRRWPDRRWWILWAIASAVTAGFTVLNIESTARSEMFQGAAEQLEGSRIVRTIIVLAWYLEHYVLPIGMAPWHPPESLVTWSHPQLLPSLAILAVAGGAVLWSWRYTRVGILGTLWFLATVASTLPLIPSRDVLAADRYVYLPNVGLHWMVAVLLVSLVVLLRRRLKQPVVSTIAVGLGAVGAAALLPYTWRVASFYESNLAKAERIAAVYPEEPGVWEDIGWAHYRNGDFEPAIEAARKDLHKHTAKVDCEVLQLIGMAQVRLGQVEEGIATLYRAVDAEPAYGKCYSRLGQVYYEIERYDAAEAMLVKAVEIMPDYLPSVQLLGHLYRRLGRLDDAARRYRRGLEINDFDPVSVTGLAEIEMSRGDYKSATRRFESLLSWMPENLLARTNLGVCYARTGRTADAMTAYTEVLRHDPAATTAAMNLAVLMADVGDQAGAIQLIERVCGANPGDRALLVASHDLLVRLGRLPPAAALWANALKHEPDAPDLLAWYAWTSATAGQWSPARVSAERAIGVDPGQGLAHAALVLVALAETAPRGVERHLDQLLSSGPSSPDPRHRLRNAISELGQRDPHSPWPYYVAARLLLADQELTSARLMFDEFIRLCRDPKWIQKARDLMPETDGTMDPTGTD